MKDTRQWVSRYTDDSKNELVERLWMPSEGAEDLWSPGQVTDSENWEVIGENEGRYSDDGWFVVHSSVKRL